MLVTFILLGQPILSAAECPDFSIFFKEIDPATKTWKILYRFYKNYPGCDDGAYGEGYADFVVLSLAKHWGRLNELVSLVKHDPSFQDFVLKHIDETADSDDLRLLLKNVRQQCPSTGSQLCTEIERAALSALEQE